MSAYEIYEDIFEAVHHLDPANPFYKYKTQDGVVFRNNRLTSVDMDDGTWVAMPISFDARIYRGESALYDSCKPNLYRINDKNERCCIEVKRCDFELFLLETDIVKKRLQDHGRVDTLAIAQHYGFPTKMLDVTKDIVVAAFFATHRFNRITRQWDPVEEGIGRIRWGVEIAEFYIYESLRIFGDQIFVRPRMQNAMGVVLNEEDDFSDHGGHIEFYQSKEMAERFDRCVDRDMLLPPWEPISNIASQIMQSEVVTSMGIERYANESGLGVQIIAEIIKKQGLCIVDAPVVYPGDISKGFDCQYIPGNTERVIPMFTI